MQIVNSKLKYFTNMITLDVLETEFSSVESEFCIEENPVCHSTSPRRDGHVFT